MSKKLLKQRAFSEEEFKSADRLGKIYINLLNPEFFPLNPTDEEYRDKLKACFMLYKNHVSEFSISEELSGIYPTASDAHIRNILRDTKLLFGNLQERNRAFDKFIQRERIMRWIQLAEEDEDWKSIASFEKLLVQIDGTNKDTEKGFDPDMLKLPTLVFKNDPKIFFEEAQIVDEGE